MNRKLGFAVLASMVSGTAGCGSDVSGETWLIAAGGDTATVAEIGAAWDRLDDAGRGVFTARDNPLGQFLLASSRKMMIDLEIDAHGFLSDPDLAARGDAWYRFEAGSWAIESLRAGERTGITGEDLRFFLERAGRWAWYTLHPGAPDEEIRGPEHLPEILPMDLLAHLDTLTAGRTLPDASGMPVRLDSILLQDSASLAAIFADSAQAREMAMESLMLTRAAARMREILDGMHSGFAVRVDTAAVERLAAMYRGEAEPVEEALLTSDLRSWTSGEFRAELSFLGTRMYTQPASAEWLLYCLDNLLLQIVLMDLQGLPAGLEDSLRRGAEAYVFDLAAEALYDAEVSSPVTVAEEDILYQFEYLTPPTEMPERRILRVARVPLDLAGAYREAVADGSLGAFLGEMDGIPSLAASDGDPQRTRPMTDSEIPPEWAEYVYGVLDPASAEWSAPFRMQGSEDYVVVRVAEILPAGDAVLEDVRTQVASAARSRLEEEATVRWMQQLEQKYGLDINEHALDRLPADPGLWSDL